MNCAELQQLLPDVLEGERTAEQAAHLQSCSACSGLVSDLRVISQQARLLQACEEPSPRLWNSLEIALRAEGLIRPPRPEFELASTAARRWSPMWLMPVAAALLITFAVLRYVREPGPPQLADRATPVATADLQPVAHPLSASDDQQLLTEVGLSSPTMRTAYEADLQNANAYIRDAEQSARRNPNDEEAQRYLMNAYEQKDMVYEMALDRSLP
jgi:hypothetical protein